MSTDTSRPTCPTWPTWNDWLIIGALVAMSWLAIFVAHDLGGEEAATSVPRWVEYTLAAAMLTPLGWRRERPLTVLVVVATLSLVFWGLRVPDAIGPTAALFLALYAAGAHSAHPARDRLRGVAVAATMLLVVYQLFAQQDDVGFDALVFATYTVAVNIGFFVAGWMLGDAARRRREDQRELRRRAEQLAAEQRERERRAVLDERVRIARELHDVVAHHVSVMGVQAGRRDACSAATPRERPRCSPPSSSRGARPSASCSAWWASSAPPRTAQAPGSTTFRPRRSRRCGTWTA